MNGERYGKQCGNKKLKCTHSYEERTKLQRCYLEQHVIQSNRREPAKKTKNLCSKNVSTHNFTRVFLYLTVFYCVPLFVVLFRGQYDLRPQLPQHCVRILIAHSMFTVHGVLMRFNYWICNEDMHSSFIVAIFSFFNRTISALQIIYHCYSEYIKGLHCDAGSYSTARASAKTQLLQTDKAVVFFPCNWIACDTNML